MILIFRVTQTPIVDPISISIEVEGLSVNMQLFLSHFASNLQCKTQDTLHWPIKYVGNHINTRFAKIGSN